MRTKKRMTKFLIAATAVSVLGAVAPASAGCNRATLYVKRSPSGTPTYIVGPEYCIGGVDTPWQENFTPVNQEVDVSGHGVYVAVGAKVTLATP